MEMSVLAKKLRLTSGMRALVLGGPEDYLESLKPLPKGSAVTTKPGGQFGWVQLFALNSEKLTAEITLAIQSLETEAVFWICYPKKSGRLVTDLNRDQGWDPVMEKGFRPVAQVSMDEDWSAVRFRFTHGTTPDDLEATQFAGPKSGLRAIYDRLVAEAQSLGLDVQVVPRKTYVALQRKKQFAILQTSTRTWLDLGLKLPGEPAGPRLAAAGGFGSGSITHKVGLESLDDVDPEVVGWLRSAYEGVG